MPLRRSSTNPRKKSQNMKCDTELHQANILETITYAKENNGYKYIVTMINCSTKLTIAFLLKTKSTLDVSLFSEPILKNHRMKHFQTYRGKEFFNKQVQK